MHTCRIPVIIMSWVDHQLLYIIVKGKRMKWHVHKRMEVEEVETTLVGTTVSYMERWGGYFDFGMDG